MTECDEVAAAMLPGCPPLRDETDARVHVRLMMPDESMTVVDNVAEALWALYLGLTRPGRVQCIVALAATLLLAGCALEPTAVRVEAEHVSHLTQHFDGQNYGHESVGAVAKWQLGHAYIEAGEYYSLDRLDGRREVFEGRVGYEFSLRSR